MSTQIVIKETVDRARGRTVKAELDGRGITVFVEPGSSHFVPWDNVTNMEWLAEKFRDLRVYEFRGVCRLLYTATTLQAQIEIKPSVPGLDETFKKQREWQEYVARTSDRMALMDALATRAAFDKMPGQRTGDEQAAWDEHQAILREQLDDEQAQGL